MKKLRQLLTGLLIVLMVCSMNTVAFAIETVDTGQTEFTDGHEIIGRYTDVSPESEYFTAIEEISNLGYVNGIGNNQFAPDSEISIRQLSVMLARHFEKTDLLALEIEEGVKFGEYCGSWLFKEDILWLEAVVNLDQSLCRSSFYDIMFEAFDVDIYPAALYPGYEEFPAWQNSVRVASEIGLCAEDVSAMDIITRGEAVYTIHWLMTNEYEVIPPEIAKEYPILNPENVALYDYMEELDAVPDNIMDEFIRRGWKYEISWDEIEEFGRGKNETYIGLCSYVAHRIYVCDSAATLHEFGHFLDYIEGWPSNRLWHEHEAAHEFLRDYAMTGPKEYYADYFDYFLTHFDRPASVEMMQTLTPNTYSYFAGLAANEWDI